MKHLMLVMCVLAGCSPERASSTDGTMGLEGPAGPAGPAGATGSQGPAGPQGQTGLQGAAGPTGAAGPAGNAGAAGATGPAGAMGLQGAAGPQGLPGATGSPGATGLQGPAGPKGATGAAAPVAMVFDKFNNQLGILLSATPGAMSYIARGDVLTGVPDGSIVSTAPETINTGAVYYTNNDCTGVSVSPTANGYVPMANFIYHGHQDRLYTADLAITYSSIVVQSYSLGTSTCTLVNFGTPAHALLWVGNGNPPASLPWHVVLQ